MNVGELFVSLGIKGSEKTVGALNDVKKNLGEAKSMSIEAKAAIIGAVYALERLFASSGQRGTELVNFNALLGMSTKTLQQYQYAARQVGVSNEEVASTFKGLSATATNVLLGKGAPEGMARIAQITGAKVGEIQGLLRQATEGNVEPLFKKLNDYALHESNIGLRNKVLKDFMGENMISAAARDAFRPDILAKAPVYNNGEQESLDKSRAAWANLGNTIEMAIGHFNAKHGQELVNGISGITEKVIKLAESLVIIAEKFKLFETVGSAFTGIDKLINNAATGFESLSNNKGFLDSITLLGSLLKGIAGALSSIVDSWKVVNELTGMTAGLGALATKTASGLGMIGSAASNTYGEAKGYLDTHKEPIHFDAGSLTPFFEALNFMNKSVAPNVSPAASGAGSTQNITVNQSMNFQHDGKDTQKTKGSIQKAANDAYRQSFAQGQRN